MKALAALALALLAGCGSGSAAPLDDEAALPPEWRMCPLPDPGEISPLRAGH